MRGRKRWSDGTGGADADFLVLAYHGGDKVYVPVEKFHLVQKFKAGEGHRAQGATILPDVEAVQGPPEELGLEPVAHRIGVGFPHQDGFRTLHGLHDILQGGRLPVTGEDPEVVRIVHLLGSEREGACQEQARDRQKGQEPHHVFVTV